MSSILAPLSGCVNLNDLHGDLTWYITGPDRHKAGAWQTGDPGCGPTTHHQRELIIDGGTSVLRNPAPDEVIAIRFDYAHWDPCGRFQIDVKNDVTGEMAALVINAGVRCLGRPEPPSVTPGPPKPGTPVVIPPIIVVPDTPYVPEVPVVTPVPEPGTLLLFGSAIIGHALWMKVRG